MKVLAWDVGIINLAGCIITKGDPYNIHWWNIVNLLNQDEIYCNYCKNPAKVTINNQLFCGVHKKKANEYIQSIPPFVKINRSGQKCTDCIKNGIWVQDNKYYCTPHKNRKEKNDKALKDVKRKTAGNTDLAELKYNLFHLLDKCPELLQVDHVIIENQPVYKNPRMKSIASTLYDYFLVRGIVDKEKTKSTIKTVRFVSPSNKLKLDNNNTVSVLSKSESETEKYKLTKELGIKYCTQLIKDDKKNYDFLMTCKKKDDLCDAMLFGVYYLTRYSK